MIFGARVSPSGTILDPSGIALSTTLCRMPAVEFDGSRFLSVWARSNYIEGVFVTTGGATQETVLITTGTTTLYSPNIAFGGANYLVVWLNWNGSVYEIIGQRVSTSGALIGSQILIGSTLISTKPGLSFDGINYIVSWTESYDIYARKYTTSGSPTGPAFPVSTHANLQLFNDVCSGTNKYFFTWAQITSGYDVYGNVDIVISVNENYSDDMRRPFIVSNLITDIIYFDNPQNCKIEIFDAAGKHVGNTSGASYDSRNLNPGIYFIQVENTTAGKIIKLK